MPTKALMMVGDDACDRMGILMHFINNLGDQGYGESWIDHDTVEVLMKYKKELVNLRIVDVSDSNYKNLIPKICSDTRALIMCFSIAKADTYRNIAEKWIPEMDSYCPEVPIILVGNASDVPKDEERKRPLKVEDGQELAKQIGAFKYLECSVPLEEGVTEIFEAAIEVIEKKHERAKSCYLK